MDDMTMIKQNRMVLAIYRALPKWLRHPLVWLLAPKHGVGVVAIVYNEQNQVLVLHQTYDEPIRLPGGIMEYGEQPEETICRELLEEAQCVIQPISCLGVSRINRRKFDIFLYCRLVEQHPFIENEEVSRIEWRDATNPANFTDLPILQQKYIESAKNSIVF